MTVPAGRAQKISAALSGAAVCLARTAAFLFANPAVAQGLIHSGQMLPDGSGVMREAGWLQYRLECIKTVLAHRLKPAKVYNYNPVTHFDGPDSLYISWPKQPLLSVFLYQKITSAELSVACGNLCICGGIYACGGAF